MTQDDKKYKLAEYRGWKMLPPEVHPAITYEWALPPGCVSLHNKDIVPDYPDNLNDLREFEIWLLETKGEQVFRVYVDTLVSLMQKDEFTVSASAPQRFEALGKTLKLW